jgi:phosphoribosyl 1,2-cyclic phosphate phosphodiesterase
LEDELLIDFNEDTYWHSLQYDFDLSKISNAVITHVHSDHFDPIEFFQLLPGQCHPTYKTFQLYGSKDVEECSKSVWKAYNENGRLEGLVAFNEIKPYETKVICGVEVTALPASHGTENPYVYIFSKNGKTMLLFNDSGYLKPEVMKFLKEKKIKFDLVSYDCTWGEDNCGNGAENIPHMGVPNNVIARQRFIANGNYKEGTIDIITHFSHNIPTCGYDDMLKVAVENGFILAYDGMEIDF